ncbi:hypothetical protein ACIQVC_25840 [Streptomyces sp. NPDC101112]|uniref:hypothetical protein n=1 Tax=Streptomyces sp. NPDC101112 TaxID=3366105 RepID=UPI00382D138B
MRPLRGALRLYPVGVSDFLVVDDYDEAIRFSTEDLGFRLVEDSPPPDGSRPPADRVGVEDRANSSPSWPSW